MKLFIIVVLKIRNKFNYQHIIFQIDMIKLYLNFYNLKNKKRKKNFLKISKKYIIKKCIYKENIKNVLLKKL